MFLVLLSRAEHIILTLTHPSVFERRALVNTFVPLCSASFIFRSEIPVAMLISASQCSPIISKELPPTLQTKPFLRQKVASSSQACFYFINVLVHILSRYLSANLSERAIFICKTWAPKSCTHSSRVWHLSGEGRDMSSHNSFFIEFC